MIPYFIKLTEPNLAVLEAFDQWANDPDLVPLIRPSKNKSELERYNTLTLDGLAQRLNDHHIYLIYMDGQLIGEMNYMIDPVHLYKKVPETAWVAITIGEQEGRNKGIGYLALQYLEEQIKKHGLKRIELGVFEFNINALKLYQKLGYKEIGRIDDFTYWQDKMWSDIRMEKYIGEKTFS